MFVFIEDPEGVKWEMGYRLTFWLRKWDRDSIGNGICPSGMENGFFKNEDEIEVMRVDYQFFPPLTKMQC